MSHTAEEIQNWAKSLGAYPVKMRCTDFWFLVPSPNDEIRYWIDSKRPWEFFYPMTSRDGTVVEVGAHIGSDTIPMSKGSRQIIAIEPDPDSFRLLQANLQFNSISNCRTFNAAIGDLHAVAKLHTGPPQNSSMSSLAPNPGCTNLKGTVDVRTLDELLSDVTDCTLLHIDTEGHDIRVLLGAQRFMAAQKSRPVIKMEFNPTTLKLHGSSVQQLFGFLDQFKYRIHINAMNTLAPVRPETIADWFITWTGNAWTDLYMLPVVRQG